MICINCGSRLSEADRKCSFCGEEKPCAEEIENIERKTFEKADKLIPSTFDKVMKWVCFISAPVFIIIGILFTETIFNYVFFISAMLSVIAGIFAGYPDKIWSSTKRGISRDAHAKDMSPTDWWSFKRKAYYWLFYSFALFLFFYSL